MSDREAYGTFNMGAGYAVYVRARGRRGGGGGGRRPRACGRRWRATSRRAHRRLEVPPIGASWSATSSTWRDAAGSGVVDDVDPGLVAHVEDRQAGGLLVERPAQLPRSTARSASGATATTSVRSSAPACQVATGHPPTSTTPGRHRPAPTPAPGGGGRAAAWPGRAGRGTGPRPGSRRTAGRRRRRRQRGDVLLAHPGGAAVEVDLHRLQGQAGRSARGRRPRRCPPRPPCARAWPGRRRPGTAGPARPGRCRHRRPAARRATAVEAHDAGLAPHRAAVAEGAGRAGQAEQLVGHVGGAARAAPGLERRRDVAAQGGAQLVGRAGLAVGQRGREHPGDHRQRLAGRPRRTTRWPASRRAAGRAATPRRRRSPPGRTPRRRAGPPRGARRAASACAPACG